MYNVNSEIVHTTGRCTATEEYGSGFLQIFNLQEDVQPY